MQNKNRLSAADSLMSLQLEDLSFVTAEFHQSGSDRAAGEEEETPEGIKTAQR